jgi:prevent-host-death family protein
LRCEHAFVNTESSNHKGSVAEAKIAAAAIELGIPVLRPITEHGRYDLVFDLEPRLLRVQCKWANLRDGVVQVHLAGSYLTPRGYVRRSYSADEIDAVVAYCGDLDECYFLPIELIDGQRAIHLRLTPPKNGQRAAINIASDYEFTGAVAQWEERCRGTAEVTGSSPVSSIPPTKSSPVEVGAHVFRNHFGWYMQRAHAGEEILITRRGRPHARLGPPHPQLSAPSQPLASGNGDASGGRIEVSGPYRSHEPTSTR